jgi:hypothetical protein
MFDPAHTSLTKAVCISNRWQPTDAEPGEELFGIRPSQMFGTWLLALPSGFMLFLGVEAMRQMRFRQQPVKGGGH